MAQTIFEMTGASLTKELGAEIPDGYVIIAKHQVMGLTQDAIAELLGVKVEDVVEAELDPVYKIVKNHISMAHAEQAAQQTAGWDAIEQMAINGLAKRVPFEKDTDKLLKIAAVANRATRKHSETSSVLNPNAGMGRTTISLTQRLVQRLNRHGAEEIEETRQLSISNGSMSNPTFKEVDSLLTVKSAVTLPRAVEVQVHNADPTVDELEQFMSGKK